MNSEQREAYEVRLKKQRAYITQLEELVDNLYARQNQPPDKTGVAVAFITGLCLGGAASLFITLVFI